MTYDEMNNPKFSILIKEKKKETKEKEGWTIGSK